MKAYYNENDPYAAAWLRELIKEGLIAHGDVDERSITEVRASDLDGYIQCHFFAGIGGWSYALRLAGWPDDRPVWTGSCPCQPASNAGHLLGEKDERDLWPVWFPLIEERKPATVFGEQVASAAGLQWLDRLHDDLEASDYAVAAADLCAPCVGAADIRQRLWFVADRDCARLEMGNVAEQHRTPEAASAWRELERVHAARTWPAWKTQSGVGVFDDGVSNRMVRGSIAGFGNAIKPQVAQAFIESYLESVAEAH